MMESYKLFTVFVVLCTVYSVHSYGIRGTIGHDNGAVHELSLSNYISGENWINTRILTLDRFGLEATKNLPTLTIANFKSIPSLYLTNIALENVPVFVNTSCEFVNVTGNKIKTVPANAFSEPRPRRLDLSNNEIFKMADRSVNIGARYVHLQCNKISQFSESWFEDPGSMKVLDLNGNRIVHIPDRAFNQMTMLERVHLANNFITSIGSEAFTSGIMNLALDFNDIAQLTPDMFAARDKRMFELYLHHNQLSYLSEALLLKLKPDYISLFGNPWQCQCLRDLERWIRELNSKRYDIPVRRREPECVVPLSFQNLCIPTVDKELQQTYASRLSPVPECLASKCIPCNSTENLDLVELI